MHILCLSPHFIMPHHKLYWIDKEVDKLCCFNLCCVLLNYIFMKISHLKINSNWKILLQYSANETCFWLSSNCFCFILLLIYKYLWNPPYKKPTYFTLVPQSWTAIGRWECRREICQRIWESPSLWQTIYRHRDPADRQRYRWYSQSVKTMETKCL